MSSRGTTPVGLAIATAVLLVSVAAAPWLASWAYHPSWFQKIGAILAGPLIPPLAVAIWQTSVNSSRQTFRSGPLIAAAICDGMTVAAIAAAADAGILLSFVSIPVASALTALSWVQPPELHRLMVFSTIVLGFAVPPLLNWLAVVATHHPDDALPAGACITTVLACLWGLRRRSTRLVASFS